MEGGWAGQMRRNSASEPLWEWVVEGSAWCTVRRSGLLTCSTSPVSSFLHFTIDHHDSQTTGLSSRAQSSQAF